MTPPAMAARVMQAIGSDRYLTRQELLAAVGDSPALGHAWDVYQRGFGGYCEIGADPLWSRLSNPARDLGTVMLDQDQSVIVLGTGPSAAVALPSLREVRARVHVITSPRGAEWLGGHGLTPDLVVVEHQSPLDAHLSVRHLSDIGRNPLRDVPLVAAEARTPAVLLSGVAQDRLFVPADAPTWGLWPATAVAMAAQAGAARIALLGVDLGTSARPDPAYAPLSDLLGLLSQTTTATTLDGGTAGARKPGWIPADLERCAAGRPRIPMSVQRVPAPSVARRHADLMAAGRRQVPRLERARNILRLALAARAGQAVPHLADMAAELLAWRDNPQCRVDLQESLGVTLLPRLWRTGIDLSLGAALWRPLMLATHELTGQADRLDARIRREAA